MGQLRDQRSRFRSSYNVGQLPSLVRVIALAADPVDPLGLSQRRFDAARASAGHPDAPSARQICARLGRGWREVLALALEQNSPDRALGRQDGEIAELLSEKEIVAALRTVLAGEAGTGPDDYERARSRLLRADRRRRHGRRLTLPTAAQITRSAGSWNAALALADLTPPQRGGPAPALERLLNQIERYLQAEGALPGKRELGRWLEARGEPVTRPPMPWQKCLEALRRRRGAAGLWTPSRASRHGVPGRPRKGAGRRRTSAASASATEASGARRRTKPVTRERCQRAMDDFLAWLPSSQRPTQRAYREFCRQRPGAPWPSSFARHGGWGAMRNEALRRRRAKFAPVRSQVRSSL